MSTLVHMLYHLYICATAWKKVGCCVSLSLKNCHDWQGVTHAFCDEVCHVDGSFILCSFEQCKVNFVPGCHVI